ncbi:MAG: DEAD/DEAH box helicase [Candidatus Nanohaloarchaeota archaeon]|nr:DEAD/DEAH box helicase [Candidatus Nanohaloarchaeota archaeon]
MASLLNYVKQQPQYFESPFIKPQTLEKRKYQENIIRSVLKHGNTLVVLPTGLGKTVIAAVVVSERLSSVGGKALIMAPTKPLVDQHYKFFANVFNLPKDQLVKITGQDTSEKRKDKWEKGKIFFATPQVVKNDIEKGILNLKDFSVVVFDEAHKAVGDYAYTFIAKHYHENAENELILALTASPGGDVEKIGSVIGNLYIKNVEIRSEYDEDVKPYIHKVDIEWVKVSLTEDLKKIDAYLKAAYNERISKLVEWGIIRHKRISKKELLEVQKSLALKIKEDRSGFYIKAMAVIGQAIKIAYAIELLETQGLLPLTKYYKKLKSEKNKTRALEELLDDANFVTAMRLAQTLLEKGFEHPKMRMIRYILEKEIHDDKKGIVFTQYVDTAEEIVEVLKRSEKLKPVLFIGQRKGMSQKKQIEIIEKFRKGEYNVLVATSVAEEGLDIPKVDVVVFYEPIPSEIRTIQRRGRTGRFKHGKIIVMITQNSLDEAYYWSSLAKERKMKRTLVYLKKVFNQKGKTIEDAPKIVKNATLPTASQSSAVTIAVDDREQKLYELLLDLRGKKVERRRLAVGDVEIGGKIIVERKKAEDFLNSLVDGRLFKQLDLLAQHAEVPILIIEGDLYKALQDRNIKINAVLGALTKIATDFQIPVLYTPNTDLTAITILLLAKRLQEEKQEELHIKKIKRNASLKKLQEFVVGSYPNISTTLAKRILSHFKTIKNYASASIDELMTVEGIGKKKAEKIWEINNKPYE